MKDYSLNLEERKDFILRYDVTENGMIKIIFAKGKPWYVPYNKENEKIILEKMEKQLANPFTVEKKLKDKLHKYFSISGGFIGASIIPLFFIPDGFNGQIAIIMSSIMIGASLIPGILAIKTNNKIKDFRKNVKFLEIEEKLNEVVRSNKIH